MPSDRELRDQAAKKERRLAHARAQALLDPIGVVSTFKLDDGAGNAVQATSDAGGAMPLKPQVLTFAHSPRMHMIGEHGMPSVDAALMPVESLTAEHDRMHGAKGDVEGHDFHGNQWTGGGGSGGGHIANDKTDAENRAHLASHGADHGHTNGASIRVPAGSSRAAIESAHQYGHGILTSAELQQAAPGTVVVTQSISAYDPRVSSSVDAIGRGTGS